MRTKRIKADIDLWRIISKMSIELDVTKQEVTKIMASYLRDQDKYECFKDFIRKKPKRNRNFDFRF